MNTHPVNLAIRFLLEMVMLIISAYWGWHLSGTWTRYIAAPCLPLTAAVLWGVFRIPNDPKSAPVAIPGILRLFLELGLFSLSCWALYDLGYPKLALMTAITVTLHYIVSYDRTWAMIRNKPYNAFVK